MRGDRPALACSNLASVAFTPHARGSTLVGFDCGKLAFVYPACAGIDLVNAPEVGAVSSLPRMRGDRPYKSSFPVLYFQFTPHARGSTLSRKISPVSSSVYPACAGIDLPKSTYSAFALGLPRMRGDRP